MSEFDTIVIGSGAGGLTTALSLARVGQRVLVLEQHSLPGGWCHSFSLEGFLYSPGVHYIGQLQPGGRLRQIYEGLGVANDLTFLELNPDGFDHVVIGDQTFDIPKGRQRYLARLQKEFPAERQNLDKLFLLIDSLANVSGKPRSLLDQLRLVTLGLRSIDHLLDRVGIKDERLRAILTVQSGDHGMAPSQAPAALHAAIMAHYFEGGYYPKGGARSIPRAFIRGLTAHGGEIRVNTPVAKIQLEGTHRRRAIGVRLGDGTFITADQVVSNADPHITFNELIGKENLSRRLQKRLTRTEYSHSAISLFCATDLDLAAMGFDSGNYWRSNTARVEEVYDQAKRTHDLGDDDELPGIFLTITTLKDRSKRQDGLHTMECFSLASYDLFQKWKKSEYGERPDDYERYKAMLSAKMLQSMEKLIPGVSQRIVFSELGTPLTKAHYIHATRGSLYGTSKRWNQIGPWAYPVKTEIEGLFMCGASTAAHGVAGATETGIMAAKQIAKCPAQDFLTASGQQLVILPCDSPEEWTKTNENQASKNPIA